MLCKKFFLAIMLGLAMLLPKEAWVGTYSAYVKYFDGFAIWVDINIGSMRDREGRSGSAEMDALQKQREHYDTVLSESDARFIQLYQHFSETEHPYRRHLGLVFSGRHPEWKEPESMWASEMTTSSVKIPWDYIHKPHPKITNTTLRTKAPVLAPIDMPRAVSFALYLKKHESREKRNALIGEFLASQITPGGFYHDEPELSASQMLTPDVLEKKLAEMAGSLEPYNLPQLLEIALHHRSEIRQLADSASDPSLKATAATLRSWLDQHRLKPEEVALIAKANTGRALPFLHQAILFDQDIALLE